MNHMQPPEQPQQGRPLSLLPVSPGKETNQNPRGAVLDEVSSPYEAGA